MSTPVNAAVAIGSNVGDRRAHVDAAVAGMAAIAGVRVVAVSPVIETDPVGPVEQGFFLNAACLLETAVPPRALLEGLLRIERERGRDRVQETRWGPRTLDLDLLLYGDRVINEPGLAVPHPRLHERRFVLEPLAMIAPVLVVPTLGRTVESLLAALPRR